MLAVAVGFGSATAVFQAAGLEPLGGTDPVMLDELDMGEHCRSVHGPTSNAMLVGADASSWRCSTRENEIFRLVEIDFDLICTTRFGESAHANIREPDDANSWECIER